MTSTIQTLSIRGKDYTVSDLGPDIQNLLDLFGKWEAELKQSKVEVFKLEAALKGLSAEIEHRVSKIPEASS